MILADGVNNPIHTLKILLTSKCNLSCRYCFIYKELSKYYQPKVSSLKRAIDIFSYFPISQKNIDIAGGEPFLYFKELKEISEYAHQKIDNVHISLTTNGTLIKNQHIGFLKENNIELKISIDGRKQAHDLNRHFKYERNISTYNRILKTIDIISKNRIKLKAIMVFDPVTLKSLYNNLLHLIKLGFTHIDFYPELYALWKSSDLKTLDRIFTRICELYLSNLAKNKLPFRNSLLFSFLGSEGIFKHSNCNKIFIDSKGNFYCCDKVFSLPKYKCNNYLIGSARSGVDSRSRTSILDRLRQEIAAMPCYKCRNCSFIKYCFCPIGLYLYTKHYNLDTHKYFYSFCRISKIYIKNFLYIKSKILENKIHIFSS